MTPLELALVLLSALLHASWNAAAKGSGEPTAFLLAMELTSLVFALPVLLLGFDPRDVAAEVWVLMAVSAAVHAVYAWALTRTYTFADLSLAYPIVRSTPAFVPLVAVPLLGEHLSFGGALGIALVVGSLWTLQLGGPGREPRTLDARALASRGARFAYLTLAVTVAYSLVDKQAMARLSEGPWSGAAPRAVFYMAAMWVLYLPLFALLARRHARLVDVRKLLHHRRIWRPFGAAVFGFVSYALILHALQTAPVSYVVAVRQASVLFVLVISVLSLRERPGPVRAAGAAMNVAGVALIALSS